jgi:hypothetical protein
MVIYYFGTNCTYSGDTLIFSSDTSYSLPIVVSRTDKAGCYTLTSESEATPASPTPFSSTFTTCQDCMLDIQTCEVPFTNCSDNQTYYVPYSFIYSLPFVPQVNQVYLVTIYNGIKYIQSCFYIGGYNYQVCKRPATLWDLISISPSSFGLKDGNACEDCADSAPSYWRVRECISGNNYIVSLPVGPTYKDYGITFTIDTLGVDLYCGIIGDRIQYSPPTAFVSSIIGFIGGDEEKQSIFCEECVASGATKVEIRNCLDIEDIQVIWGSNLFNPGDVSNISLGGGSCYEIISATTAPVTINELLNYEPSPTCTDCLNCEQVELTLIRCGDVDSFPIVSNQYAPVGTIISDGFRCYEVVNVLPTSGITEDSQIVSFPTFETCPECEDASFQRWVGTSCNDDHQDFITLTGTTSFVPGQIVQVQRNGSDFICYKLDVNVTGGEIPPLPNTPNYYYSLTQTPFNTCKECSSGSTVGITIIDCDYASASYVTVSLYDYLRLTGGDGNPATPVLQYEGKCHLLLNECPIDNTYPLVTSTLYNNCIECSEDLNLTRYSGTTCFSQEPINVTYNQTNILTSGTIVLTNNGTCVTISGETNETNTEGTITTTGLTSCYECYLNDDPTYNVFFQSCLDNEVYSIPLNLIGFLPLLGEIYFLDFTIEGKPFQSCFTVVGLEPIENNKVVFNSISLPYVDCEECFTNNLVRYIVQDCVSGEFHVIGYPSTGLVGLVTYTPIGEVDQYCGNILEITTSEPIDSSLITILGRVECEDCLSAVAKKRILTNCLNGNQVVVWSSLLFTEGNITHIQTGEGCYEIGPETELEVTINEFLDFDNYPSCQECIQCNGVHYFYSACTPDYNITSISSTSPGYYTYLQVFDQANNILWFTDGGGGGTLVKFDVLSQTVINSYSFGFQIQDFLFLHPSNGNIYFNNSSSLRSFDTVTGVFYTIYTSPFGGNFSNYYYDPTTDNIWLPNLYASRIIVFNLTTNVSQVINVPYQYPKPITYNPNNNKIYVVDYFNPYFYVIDRTTLNVDSVYSMSSNYQSDVIFYENSTNRVFGRNFYIDCSTNTSYNTNIYTLYDIIQDPTTGYLISPSGGDFLYIIDPVNLTSYNSSFINSAGYYISYNSPTNQFYLTTNYYNTILTVSLGDVYNIGEIDSYQYAPLNSYFFHPIYGCSIIYNILPSSGITPYNFYSFENFDTCEDCTNVEFDVWEAYNCITDDFVYVVTNSGVYNSGDLVNVKWGETDFICFILDYLITNYENINLDNNFYFADSVVKPSCENCSDGTSVSISIIDCNNQNSMFVNVPLSVWFILTGYNDTIPRPVFLFGNTCYKVLNECPFSPEHYPINPSYIFYNCESCGNPLEANSETVLCLQNCSGGTYTVSVNHPYWTNQYGMAVIQNNAVGLGGQTGYNT